MTNSTMHFYVDEAGDLSLVGRRGRSLLGTEGVSNYFMVGTAQINSPHLLRTDLEAVRARLLADPYLRSIPSMQPEAGKTARAFHAKDDCPEVRMQVFKTLAQHDIRIIVGIKRKRELIELMHFAKALKVKSDTESVYDVMVTTMFKQLLHKADANIIYFARRGKSARQAALQKAIARSQTNFTRDTGIPSDRPTQVIPTVPSEETGLQAIDYFLWAVQRLYERGEDRYFEFVRKQFKLVMDFDDKRSGKSYGTWYTDKNPLTKEKIESPTAG